MTHPFEAFPAVPLTIEGSSVLHQMLRVRWPAWRALAAGERSEILAQAAPALTAIESATSALFSLLGHKGDLMLVHFRKNFDELGDVQRCLTRMRLWDFFEQTTSYLSVVELGLYESTVKTYPALAERGLEPHTPEWNAAIEETLERQRTAMRPRLFPDMPPHKYLCFYPMDRRRGEQKNWYEVPMLERQRQMQEHGEVGRRYAGAVKQIITGSIGFDDWEWGVDLFAEDPLVFKRLIYEMRFDQVSAVYALFGSFYIGRRTAFAELPNLLSV
ncbi:MAG TPA: hydrogen peroxide-dependent heme synthase [Bryobacteraceae bacterium]|nr:hydrogen peroxide-dependent heme synthase [Bryobacteraceae bacterium]